MTIAQGVERIARLQRLYPEAHQLAYGRWQWLSGGEAKVAVISVPQHEEGGRTVEAALYLDADDFDAIYPDKQDQPNEPNEPNEPDKSAESEGA